MRKVLRKKIVDLETEKAGLEVRMLALEKDGKQSVGNQVQYRRLLLLVFYCYLFWCSVSRLNDEIRELKQQLQRQSEKLTKGTYIANQMVDPVRVLQWKW